MNPAVPMICAALVALGQTAQAQGTLVGLVQGQPIYASQVKGATEEERAESLRSLLVMPAIQAYLAPYKKEWTVTEAETAALAESFTRLSQCRPEWRLPTVDPEALGRGFAAVIGGKMKIQRFIYLNNGGGRMLFQQSGTEAFDATRRLVLQLEKHEKFQFVNRSDRELALSYWTQKEHRSLWPDPGPDKAFQLDSLLGKCP